MRSNNVAHTFLLFLAGCAAHPPSADLRLEPLASPTTASLRGVSAVTGAVAFASGSDGTVLRTLDGGATWHPCGPALARGRDLRDVHAFDALHAVVMAVDSPALLFHTKDGGATWQVAWRSDHPDAFLDAVDFVDAQQGFAFGDPLDGRFVTLATHDGGASWQATNPAPPPLPGEAAFAASGTCVKVLPGGDALIATGGGEVARVLRGSDLGTTWRSHTTPIRSGAPSRGIFSLAAYGVRLVAAGGDYRDPTNDFATLALSDDNGHTWRKPNGTPPRGYRSSVAFVPRTSGRTLIATGESGTDISNDGGENWQPLTPTGYHALAFAPDGTGYAVGAGGRFAKITR
jgi:photosystem II stability/assembly factor-like uncharacterized protein